jgi:hypothetical protein
MPAQEYMTAEERLAMMRGPEYDVVLDLYCLLPDGWLTKSFVS